MFGVQQQMRGFDERGVTSSQNGNITQNIIRSKKKIVELFDKSKNFLFKQGLILQSKHIWVKMT